MYKTETHVHVSESSKCGRVCADEMIKLYRDAGYKTVIISDHLQANFYAGFSEASWAESMDRFIQGYEASLKAGKKYGVNIIFSAEVRFNESKNHYLLLGIDKEFLLEREDLLDMGIKEFYPHAKAHGVTIVQAHPYRDKKCYPMVKYVDAIEVYNSNPRHENFTEKTYELAEKYNLPMTAGSDAHRLEDIALTGVTSEKEIKTAEDYVELLLNKKLKIIK